MQLTNTINFWYVFLQTDYPKHPCNKDEDCAPYSENMYCAIDEKVCTYVGMGGGFASISCLNYHCPEGMECDSEYKTCREPVTAI